MIKVGDGAPTGPYFLPDFPSTMAQLGMTRGGGGLVRRGHASRPHPRPLLDPHRARAAGTIAELERRAIEARAPRGGDHLQLLKDPATFGCSSKRRWWRRRSSSRAAPRAPSGRRRRPSAPSTRSRPTPPAWRRRAAARAARRARGASSAAGRAEAPPLCSASSTGPERRVDARSRARGGRGAERRARPRAAATIETAHARWRIVGGGRATADGANDRGVRRARAAPPRDALLATPRATTSTG